MDEPVKAGIDRRDFLKLIKLGLLSISGLLGAAGLARFLTYQPDPPPPTRFELGTVESYPLDSQTVIPQVPALLIRRREGFKALSMRCTHLGCTLEHANSNLLTCPCHGSQFDTVTGSASKGPATAALDFLHVEITPEGLVVIVNTSAQGS